MHKVERIRELLPGRLPENYLKERLEANWRLVAVEWEREIEGKEHEAASVRQEVPYGLKVAGDCLHLEENPAEVRVLELMLELIAKDKSLSEVARELNERGLRTRDGLRWNQVAVFDLLPRLIEAAPGIQRAFSAAARP